MIYIARNETRLGPYSSEQINSMLASGEAQSTDPAWWEGCGDWLTIAQAPGIILPSAFQRPAPSPAAVATPSPASPQVVYAPSIAMAARDSHMLQSAEVSVASMRALQETRPWVLLLAIVGIIMTGLMALGGVGMLVIGSVGSKAAGTQLPAGMMLGLALLYLVLALVYLYPVIKLFKYSGAISRLTRSGAVRDMDEALVQQKSFWKFMGIITLLMIVTYGIIMVVMIMTGMSAVSQMKSKSSSRTIPFGESP